jgi:hypothetical protein
MLRSRRAFGMSAFVSGLVAALAAPLGAAGIGLAAAAPRATTTFIHHPLPPPPAGSTAKNNIAAEPQIRSDAAGNFYISSENGVGAGTDAWASLNGGMTYAALPQPNEESSTSGGKTGLAPGGGDTDLATAPIANTAGVDNLYVASLTVGSVTVSASQNHGKSWTSQVLSATVPGDDREWIAAFGQTGFDLSYHAAGTGDQIIVNEGQLVSGTPASEGTYDAITPTSPEIYAGTLEDNEIGNIAVDRKTGDVFQIFVGCPPSPTAVASCNNLSTAYMAVGAPSGTLPGGLPKYTFTDYVIFNGSTTQGLNNNFPVVAVDAAGNVYAAWSNDHGVFLSYSTTHGQHWSTPRQVNSGNAKTAIFPWLTAGAAGKVDAVYYATPAAQNYQTCATTKATDPCQTEPWYVYLAQDTSVLTGGPWAQYLVTASPVHRGGVCQGGVSCTSTGNDNRDLYDDFGVAASPKTGLASIAYSDDQYADNVGSANAGECTSAQNNTSSCDHTDYATQTAGTGIT